MHMCCSQLCAVFSFTQITSYVQSHRLMINQKNRPAGYIDPTETRNGRKHTGDAGSPAGVAKKALNCWNEILCPVHGLIPLAAAATMMHFAWAQSQWKIYEEIQKS